MIAGRRCSDWPSAESPVTVGDSTTHPMLAVDRWWGLASCAGGGVRRVAVRVLERPPQGAHRRGQVRDLLEVGLGQRVLLVFASPCKRDPHDALGAIAVALDKAVVDGAVDQADGAVMSEHQVVGNLTDRGAGWVRVAFDRE